jgi:putative methanogenesis marker protein 17
MDVDVSGTDPYGNDAYKALFETIMNDIGVALVIEKAKIVLKPEVPLFIFSVRLANEPRKLTISDAASLRQEGDDVHMSISDEKYAPDILSHLWKRYGRSKVDQQTRFDLVVSGAKEDEISVMQISSGEEAKKEIIGALWRAMPEGIKVRHNLSESSVITIIATEEIMMPEMIAEGTEVHKSMLAGVTNV